MHRKLLSRPFHFACLATCAFFVPSVRAQSPLFEMIDVGTLGGPSSVALDVNERGHVVGEADDPGLERSAFIWKMSPGQQPLMTQLANLAPGRSNSAWAINDTQQVVGHAQDGNFRFQATLWQDGLLTALGTLGGLQSLAFDINASGVVVGTSDTTSSGNARAFVIGAGMQSLPGLGGSNGVAWAINDSNEIVGSSFLPGGGGEHAVLWRGGFSSDKWELIDLMPSTGRNSVARAINNHGDIAGWADYDSTAEGSAPGQASLWKNDSIGQPGAAISLGTLPGFLISRATDLNDALEVVGFATGYGGTLDRAFYWTPALGLNDLNDMIVDRGTRVMISANAINENGHIVGYGVDQGRARAFLLRPLPQAP